MVDVGLGDGRAGEPHQRPGAEGHDGEMGRAGRQPQVCFHRPVLVRRTDRAELELVGLL